MPAVPISNPAQLYHERLTRYVAAMRLGVPDKVPIRPFAAEFAARHAGLTCQEVTHDYRKAFEAVYRVAADYDWDAIVPNMVYVWTGLTQALGLRYYAIPGIDIGPDVGFQYREPSVDQAFMQPEEYDRLIADPTRFLFEVWLPRVSTEVAAGGYRATVSLVKGGMALLDYFTAFGGVIERLRTEYGMVSSISGMLKAPLDILADKLRGYVGLAFDLKEMPDKVLAACEALRPHLEYVALSGLDPHRNIPIPIWMHRGCVPFISFEHFETIYWPTLRPIFDAIIARGNQVLLYAEGDWTAHLERLAELPRGSVVFHIDRSNVERTWEALGGRFCLSGAIPNDLLAYGSPDDVRARCKQMIDLLGKDGGYIVDASAIMQNDATVENVRAMTEFTREYGVYRSPSSPTPPTPPPLPAAKPAARVGTPPGACYPWEEKLKELPELSGDVALTRRVWEQVDGWGYVFIWNALLGF
jgi:hypothetical protein